MIKLRGAGRVWRWYCYRLILLVFMLGVLSGCGAPDAGRTSAPSFALLASLAVGTPVYDVTWSADSTMLAVTSGQTIQVWDVSIHQILTTYRGHHDEVTSLAFSPDGTFLVSVDAAGWMVQWDPRSGAEQWQMSIETAETTTVLGRGPRKSYRWYKIQVSADQTLVSTNDGVDIWLWDAATGTLINRLPLGWGFRHPNDSALMFVHTHDAAPLETAHLVVWDIRADQPRQQIAHGMLGSLGFSNTGHFVVFAQRDTATLNLWNVDTAQLQWSIDGRRIHQVIFSSEDMYVAASNDFQTTVSIWTVSDGNLVTMLVPDRQTIPVNAMEFSPDREFMLTAGGNAQGSIDIPQPDSTPPIEVWRVQGGSRIQLLSGHTNAVNTLAFSPDGATLASGSSDGTIKLWRYQP